MTFAPPLALSSDAWAALGGALIGGLFTFAAQALGNWHQSHSAAVAQRNAVAATALLMQDDFLHYQATLARSIDACTWWDKSWLSAAQATVDDRRSVWAALPDKQTNTVADAQGWMDYLISSRQTYPKRENPPLTPEQLETVQMTFRYLERGRKALATLARRPATSFDKAHVLEDLVNCHSVADLLERRCPGAGAALPWHQ